MRGASNCGMGHAAAAPDATGGVLGFGGVDRIYVVRSPAVFERRLPRLILNVGSTLTAK